MISKSSVEEIRQRFDADVERFSNLETGQTATIDAALVLDLISAAAKEATPDAQTMLDIGCGAGNFTLKMLQRIPRLECTLLDLSAPMLQRAGERVSAATTGKVHTVQGDIREAEFRHGTFDLITAAAVLHHLRTEAEWLLVFGKLFAALRPGGSLWISDLVSHEMLAVQSVMWKRYSEYLAAFKGEEYRNHVFRYIEQEDSPSPVLFQCELLRRVGFREIDILHKNSCFAAFGARK